MIWVIWAVSMAMDVMSTTSMTSSQVIQANAAYRQVSGLVDSVDGHGTVPVRCVCRENIRIDGFLTANDRFLQL